MLNTTLAKLSKATLFAIACSCRRNLSRSTHARIPAICIAVCGKKTCGRIAASNADMKRIDDPSYSLGSSSSSSKQSKAKPYTCSNPAICIAVCGKKTCG